VPGFAHIEVHKSIDVNKSAEGATNTSLGNAPGNRPRTDDQGPKGPTYSGFANLPKFDPTNRISKINTSKTPAKTLVKPSKLSTHLQ
jgi:hypothetical protein